jgi:DNA polymerase-3 subunit gamma/tau
MRGTTAPRLMLELLCARVLLPGAARDESSVLARLDRLERRLDLEGAPAPRTSPPQPVAAPVSVPVAVPVVAPSPAQAATPASTPARGAASPVATADPAPPRAVPASRERSGSASWPEPVALGAAAPAAAPAEQPPASAEVVAAPPAADVSAGGIDAATVRRLWPDVLEAIKQRSKRTTYALLSVYAQVVAVNGRTLTLSFSTEPIRRTYLTGTHEDVLREALLEVLTADYRVETVTAGAPVEAGAGQAAAATPAVAPAYDGFQPGDEPAEDEPDSSGEPAARTDPEEAAVALLTENLGARVIGQIDAG